MNQADPYGFINRHGWAWANLLGLNDERQILGFLGTEVATTSGTSIDFTGIPSWVTEIVIMPVGVSTSGTSPITVRIGDSGGIENTGYLHSVSDIGGGVVASFNSTSGFQWHGSTSAGAVNHGMIVLTLEDDAQFTWVCGSSIGRSDAASNSVAGGSKSLSAALDRLSITTNGGADTFDAGAINIRMR